jgi:hypothetical protein
MKQEERQVKNTDTETTQTSTSNHNEEKERDKTLDQKGPQARQTNRNTTSS